MSIKYTLDCLDPHLNKSLADHGILADVAKEALIVPSLSQNVDTSYDIC